MRLSRYLCIDADAAVARGYAATLADHATEACSASGVEQALDLIRQKGFDVIVVSCESPSDQLPETFLCAYRAHFCELDSLLLLVTRKVSKPGATEAASAPSAAGYDYLFPAPPHSAELAVRVSLLARLGTMKRELRRRANIARSFAIAADVAEQPLSFAWEPKSPPRLRLRILCATQGNDIAPDLSGSIRQVGEVEFVSSFDAAQEALFTKPADVCIIHGAGPESVRRDALSFALAVRNSPTLFNLPLVLVVPKASTAELSRLHEAGVTDVIIEPVSAEDFVQRLQAVVRLEKLRQELARECRENDHGLTMDGVAGVFTHGFIRAHMAGLMRENDARSFPTTTGFLQIENLREINERYGYAVGDAVIRNVGNLISQYIRGEDSVGRTGGGKFILLLPDTAISGARIAMSRLEAILTYRPLTLPSIDEPLVLKLKAQCFTSYVGEGADAFLERAGALMHKKAA